MNEVDDELTPPDSEEKDYGGGDTVMVTLAITEKVSCSGAIERDDMTPDEIAETMLLLMRTVARMHGSETSFAVEQKLMSFQN